MKLLRFTKPSAIKPMWWSPEKSRRSARFIKLFLLSLLIVFLIPVLSGCSKAALIVPMPLPPANLASNCPPLPNPPSTLIDPERAVWEADVIAKYGDCGLRHKMTIEAWKQAVRSK